VYGARDNGKYAEYRVLIEKLEAENGEMEDFIFYQSWTPNKLRPVNSGISIQNILRQYQYVQDCVDSGVMPGPDFTPRYSEERIQLLYDREELGKSDTERHEKYLEYKAGNRTRSIKPVEKGDWQCNYCQFKDFCYTENGEAKEF
jgi:hypothetical protein